jgi:sulfite reductase alpha subunit-like flavoprotein
VFDRVQDTDSNLNTWSNQVTPAPQMNPPINLLAKDPKTHNQLPVTSSQFTSYIYNMKRIAIFCGSKTGNDPEYANATKELISALVDKGIEIVYGGGAVG